MDGWLILLFRYSFMEIAHSSSRIEDDHSIDTRFRADGFPSLLDL